MSENVKFKVKIPAIGKADTTVEAEDALSAVQRVVSDFARRGGEPPHMMARRLDKDAMVTLPSGAKVMVNIIEACPQPAAEEVPAPDELTEAIREGIAETLDDESFGI